MLKIVIAVVLALASVLVQGQAQAQAYPSKPIRMIVPVATGASSNDILGRAMAKYLAESLGQSVYVENQAGATGTIGSRTVARAAPDGYTLLLGYQGAQAIAPSVMPDIGYDTVKDLAPVGMFATVPYVMVVHPKVPANNARELVAWLKANPDKLSFASSGTGGSPHLATELFMQETGTKMQHVPYKAAATARTDLLSGIVQVYIGGVPATAAFIKAGKLRPIMVTNTARSLVLPDVGTSAEAGFPTVIAASWLGVLAPARTPEAIINRLYGEIAKITNTQEMKTFLINQGAEPALLPPAKFGELIRNEIALWAKVIKTGNITVE
jgi:tripartite-type tricarboxylate transporter receptor subunit TctC